MEDTVIQRCYYLFELDSKCLFSHCVRELKSESARRLCLQILLNGLRCSFVLI